MTYHVCVPVDKSIELLKQGDNLFAPPPVPELLKQLLAQKERGKQYITGCDRENAEGRCAGHPSEAERSRHWVTVPRQKTGDEDMDDWIYS